MNLQYLPDTEIDMEIPEETLQEIKKDLRNAREDHNRKLSLIRMDIKKVNRLQAEIDRHNTLTIPGKGRIVYKKSIKGSILAAYPSLQSAARALKNNNKAKVQNIRSVCKGRSKTAYGFRWAYANEEFKTAENPRGVL